MKTKHFENKDETRNSKNANETKNSKNANETKNFENVKAKNLENVEHWFKIIKN